MVRSNFGYPLPTPTLPAVLSSSKTTNESGNRKPIGPQEHMSYFIFTSVSQCFRSLIYQQHHRSRQKTWAGISC